MPRKYKFRSINADNRINRKSGGPEKGNQRIAEAVKPEFSYQARDTS